MVIMGIDPSSTSTGYAIRGSDCWDIGRIKPPAGGDALERIRAMARGVSLWLYESNPDAIAIEIPHGKIHGRLAGKNPSGMAIYGMACGYILFAIHAWASPRVKIYTPNPNEWTRRTSKKHRQELAKQLCPQYDSAKDSGRDISDAICLTEWARIEMMVSRRR